MHAVADPQAAECERNKEDEGRQTIAEHQPREGENRQADRGAESTIVDNVARIAIFSSMRAER